MPISGVVILTQNEKTQPVLTALQKMDDVTTYGIHKGHYIIAVLEAENSKNLEALTRDIQENIEGVLGIYPAYVNFENELESENDHGRT